jgi:PAS domain S-box-containing protein
MPPPDLSRLSHWLAKTPAPLRLLGAALVYGVLGWIAQRMFSIDGVVGFFWPASGWALAVLLLGGRRYAWAIALGAFAVLLLNQAPLTAALPASLGATVSALLGQWLLRRDADFDDSFVRLRDYGQLLLKAALLASSISALVGVSSATLFGFLPSDRFVTSASQWWAGDALGVMLITPLVMTLRRPRHKFMEEGRSLETVLVLLAGALAGQIILLGWLPELLNLMPRKAYWLFPLIVWSAVRLGLLPVLTFLLMTTVQSMIGIDGNYGFFANAAPEFRVLDGWFFISTLALVGITLAVYFKEREKDEAELRIAATAFECQEGMIITDAHMRILRTNQSFSRIMGYSQEEVLGQRTTFMRSDRQPASFYESAWRTAREQGIWNDEVWHRRKNGEVFPQWLTATAVKNDKGVITNYVVTHTDISYRKQKEAELQTRQLEQRDALVREIHHRIKNNLQGITGLLRQFGQQHREVQEPINLAIAQVRSIAVIHGLQGRSADLRVRLCELTPAIATETAALWQAPVRVDLPDSWVPCLVAEAEAVPMALIISELITNAAKHAQPTEQGIDVRLRKGERPEQLLIRISNPGVWLTDGRSGRGGLQLVDAMLPRSGAQILRTSEDGMIHVTLVLEPPVISLEAPRKMHGPASDAQSPVAAG